MTSAFTTYYTKSNTMKKIFIISCLILALFGLSQITQTVFAEGGTGSIPSSGVTSRIKTLDDALTGLGVGSTATGAWGDWGAMWNRIYSAGIWNATLGDAVEGDVFLSKKFYAGANRTLLTGTFSFTGDAAVGDVVTGKTFYAGSSTKQTGIGPALIDYSLQKNATEDDYLGIYKDEESTWTNEADGTVGALLLSSGEIKKDSRTGLIWSAASSGTYTNSFTALTDGTRPTNGNSVGFCNGLNSDTYGGKTTWYLPTQKELMQAYIDGIYSQDTVFGTTSDFWSSSEYSSDSTYAWYVTLRFGDAHSYDKGNSNDVRCVRRD